VSPWSLPASSAGDSTVRAGAGNKCDGHVIFPSRAAESPLKEWETLR